MSPPFWFGDWQKKAHFDFCQHQFKPPAGPSVCRRNSLSFQQGIGTGPGASSLCRMKLSLKYLVLASGLVKRGSLGNWLSNQRLGLLVSLYCALWFRKSHWCACCALVRTLDRSAFPIFEVLIVLVSTGEIHTKGVKLAKCKDWDKKWRKKRKTKSAKNVFGSQWCTMFARNLISWEKEHNI